MELVIVYLVNEHVKTYGHMFQVQYMERCLHALFNNNQKKGVRFLNIFRIIILLVCGRSNMLKITCQQIIIVLVIELLLSLQHYCDLHPKDIHRKKFVMELWN